MLSKSIRIMRVHIMSGMDQMNVPMEHKFDWAFAKKAPYGLLMTAQTVCSLLIILILMFAPFQYEGMSFLFGLATAACFSIGVILLFQMAGLQKKIFEPGNGVMLIIPVAFLYFMINVVYFFLFTFTTLMCVIGLLDSLRYTVGMIVSYALLTCLSAAVTLACFRAVVLLFRAAPNGKVFNLLTVIMEGDKTVRTPGSVPQFSPVTSPTGRNVV